MAGPWFEEAVSITTPLSSAYRLRSSDITPSALRWMGNPAPPSRSWSCRSNSIGVCGERGGSGKELASLEQIEAVPLESSKLRLTMQGEGPADVVPFEK